MNISVHCNYRDHFLNKGQFQRQILIFHPSLTILIYFMLCLYEKYDRKRESGMIKDVLLPPPPHLHPAPRNLNSAQLHLCLAQLKLPFNENNLYCHQNIQLKPNKTHSLSSYIVTTNIGKCVMWSFTVTLSNTDLGRVIIIFHLHVIYPNQKLLWASHYQLFDTISVVQRSVSEKHTTAWTETTVSWLPS